MRPNRLEILEFGEQQKRLAALLTNSNRREPPTETKWEARRNALIALLSQYAKFDPSGTGEGEFFVGEDWFRTNYLAIVDYEWKLIREQVITAIQAHLRTSGLHHVATIARSAPREMTGLEILIASNEICSTIWGRTVEEVKETLRSKRWDFLLPGNG